MVDEIGNMTAGPAGATTYNTSGAGSVRPHAPTTAGATSITYRGDGTRASTVTAGVTTAYAWDPFDRLTQVARPGSVTEMVYFPGGQRALLKDAAGVHMYLGGLAERHATPAGTATTQKRYYQLGGTTIGVQTRNSTAPTDPVWDYILGDVRSSTTLTARKGSAATGQQWYSPYGAVRGTPSVTATTRGYISQHHDTTTGLSYLNNRYYDPTVGVFVSVDPLVTITGEPYLYGSGNPTSLSDPLGLCSKATPTGTYYDDGLGACGRPAPGSGGPGSNGLSGSRYVSSDGWFYEAGKCSAGCINHPLVGALDRADARELADAINARMTPPANQPATSNGDDGFFVGAVKFATIDPADCQDAVSWGCTAAIAGILPWSRIVKVLRWGDEAAALATNRADDIVGAVCSFSGETRVLMADGTTKPISKVEIGDEVLAYDPETGERGSRAVTHLWVHQDLMLELELDGARVTTTEDHPFWNATDRAWQAAAELGAGDVVLAADGGTVAVGGLDWSTTLRAAAYNLTVDDIRTYYVEVGNEEILVHNTCPGVGGLAGEFDADELAQLTYQHVGAGDIAGRPSLREIESAINHGIPVRLPGQNAVQFEYNGVRVIINEDLPPRSTAYYPGG